MLGHEAGQIRRMLSDLLQDEFADLLAAGADVHGD